MVCSYLCQACGLSVEQALESFAAARPPGVKHEKFIRELYARYGTASQASCLSVQLLGFCQGGRGVGVMRHEKFIRELYARHGTASQASCFKHAAALVVVRWRGVETT